MNIINYYRNRITELTEELHHYVDEYNRLVSKEENQKKTNAVKYKQKKRRNNPPKKNKSSTSTLSDRDQFT